MKAIYLLFVVMLVLNAKAQVLFDFTTDPLSNGWAYYDNYNSNPNAGFEYDPVDKLINYKLNTSTEISFIHTQLPNTLTRNYCVSFKIKPTNSNNYNTFFPLILTPYELTGTDLHPWRLNAISQTTAGNVQNIDFIAIEVYSNQIRFFNRDGNIMTSSSIQSMSPPFYMTVNYSYWIKLSVTNYTTATVSIYQDENFNTLLSSSTFTIPILDGMNHLYIANSNGNSNCTHYGQLDDYKINMCSTTAGLENLKLDDSEKKLVKKVDFLGREVQDQTNVPLIYIYDDGSTKKVFELNR